MKRRNYEWEGFVAGSYSLPADAVQYLLLLTTDLAEDDGDEAGGTACFEVGVLEPGVPKLGALEALVVVVPSFVVSGPEPRCDTDPIGASAISCLVRAPAISCGCISTTQRLRNL
jgi:hypothetical protein